jgi:twitching motility protein PilJ
VAIINAKNPQLLELSEQVAALKLQGGASAREIATANQVVMLTQRIAKNANALLIANAIDPEVAFLLGKDTNTFREQIEQLQKMTADGSDTKGQTRELGSVGKDNLAAVATILGSIQRLVKAKEAGKPHLPGLHPAPRKDLALWPKATRTPTPASSLGSAWPSCSVALLTLA